MRMMEMPLKDRDIEYDKKRSWEKNADEHVDSGFNMLRNVLLKELQCRHFTRGDGRVIYCVFVRHANSAPSASCVAISKQRPLYSTILNKKRDRRQHQRSLSLLRLRDLLPFQCCFDRPGHIPNKLCSASSPITASKTTIVVIDSDCGKHRSSALRRKGDGECIANLADDETETGHDLINQIDYINDLDKSGNIKNLSLGSTANEHVIVQQDLGISERTSTDQAHNQWCISPKKVDNNQNTILDRIFSSIAYDINNSKQITDKQGRWHRQLHQNDEDYQQCDETPQITQSSDDGNLQSFPLAAINANNISENTLLHKTATMDTANSKIMTALMLAAQELAIYAKGNDETSTDHNNTDDGYHTRDSDGFCSNFEHSHHDLDVTEFVVNEEDEENEYSQFTSRFTTFSSTFNDRKSNDSYLESANNPNDQDILLEGLDNRECDLEKDFCIQTNEDLKSNNQQYEEKLKRFIFYSSNHSSVDNHIFDHPDKQWLTNTERTACNDQRWCSDKLLHESTPSCNRSSSSSLNNCSNSSQRRLSLNNSSPCSSSTSLKNIFSQAMLLDDDNGDLRTSEFTNDGNDGEIINTKELAHQISKELRRYGIPQAVFAQHVLSRSQGTLSDLLRNPKPWKKLKAGKETFRKMWQWLQDPENERIEQLKNAVKKRKSTPACDTMLKNDQQQNSSYVHNDFFGIKNEHENFDNNNIYFSKSVPANTVEKESSLITQSKKRSRLVFTDIQRRTLQAIFKETKRPSKEMQITISRQLGLQVSTVSNFFMNARRRSMDKWMSDDADDDEEDGYHDTEFNLNENVNGEI
ncbi:hypothetical protein GJ496_009306 [Pomphorhynchus laevis]|nr:hypothetical protein GJ496_009306 [Pomphorhynchus laevis]